MGVCLCTTRVVPAEREEGTDLLELELEMVLSCHIGVGNRNWVL